MVNKHRERFHMKELQSTKSLLAKLLASEDIRVEHGNFQTASFDVKNRVIHLPIFKYMSGPIYDLMVLHEVGHALWTPLKGLHSEKDERGPGFKSYLNVVEDARIEKKIKRKYPGGAKPMIEGYRQLVSEDFFGTKGMNLDDLNLIDRINLHYKMGASTGITFDDVERGFIDEMDKAETFEEVFDITTRLYEYSKENESETDFQDLSMMNASSFSDDDEDDDTETEMFGESPLEYMEEEESEERKDASKGMQGDSKQEESEESEENSQGDSVEGEGDQQSQANPNKDMEEQDQKSSQNSISSGQEGGVSNGERFEPKSHTDEAWQRTQEDLNETSDAVYEYVTIPKPHDLKETVITHKELYKMINDWYSEKNYYDNETLASKFDAANRKVKEFKSKNVKTVDFLVKEFEMKKRADEYKRTASANTGLLDMSSIHEYKYSDNLFKKVATVATGKNHGLTMFIDWSGSMSGNLNGTIDQLLCLVMFCKKVNIPFEVYAFTDRDPRRNDEPMSKYSGVFEKKEGNLICNSSLHLMNFFSSSMTTQEMNKAMMHMIMIKERYDWNNYYYSSRWNLPHFLDLGGTPLDATIIASLELIPEFQRKNRVQIVNAIFLTDGESHTSSEHWMPTESGNLMPKYFNSGGKHRLFYVDPVTKKSYSCHKRRHGSTPVFYQILRDRLGVNVLGFYLIGKKFKSKSFDIAIDTDSKDKHGFTNSDDIMRTWRKEKSFVAANYLGYDRLYYIKDGQDLNTDDGEFVVKEDASKSQITRAFKSFNKKKLSSRIVLKSFAEMVS